MMSSMTSPVGSAGQWGKRGGTRGLPLGPLRAAREREMEGKGDGLGPTVLLSFFLFCLFLFFSGSFLTP